MKKTKTIQLILITAALASCAEKKKEPEWGSCNKTYVRGDSTAPYTRTHHGGGGLLGVALWYYALGPMEVLTMGPIQGLDIIPTQSLTMPT